MDALLSLLSRGVTDAGYGAILIYTLVATHVTIISVTVFLHRAQAHRALTLHPALSHFFRLWLWLSTGMVTREWVAIHRKHHAHCETAGDPHSPVVLGLDTVLWRGAELYRAAARDDAEIRRYGFGTPDDWIERHLYSRYTWQGVGVLLVADLVLFGAIGATVWAVQMLWIPFLAAGVVNGIGHFWGYRNFDCKEAATNISPVGLLIGGEELHNNHHTYARSAKMSVKWYEFDAGWMYICLFRALGLARVRELPRVPRLRPDHNEVDMQTLLAVLANRARVMADMAVSLRGVWRRELEALRGVDAPDWKAARRLLRRDPDNLSTEHLDQLNRLLAHSEVLRHVQELRAELVQLWRRSHATPDQLLDSLKAWCARAELSACEPMRRFARTLRAYA
ncbi:DesA family fatty acid desaturase [Pseudoduganella namucuonensis]|uniref:Stearoyl-CoA desaturase (Delta-9 desaturase) n=1 Tax=Pseudoduganella namucuonensis TaxID=1035707 RepID=A0A1I7F290_9BURK|nr:fatty acid desaturase [Pseudoduganella namucuonensis]SFU30286.1 stearoyl-CoA desaturase (delta-9 desaturase) [Pseudoduganella namucuonensis]